MERLDLAGNNIIQIHSMAFQHGVREKVAPCDFKPHGMFDVFSSLQVPVLSYLNLRNNLMGQVPFVSLGHVGSLKYLDLSNNRIAKIEDPFFQVRNLNFLEKQCA